MLRKSVRQLGTRTYVNYKPEVLEACLRAIKTNKMTQRKASAYFKVPRDQRLGYSISFEDVQKSRDIRDIPSIE